MVNLCTHAYIVGILHSEETKKKLFTTTFYGVQPEGLILCGSFKAIKNDPNTVQKIEFLRVIYDTHFLLYCSHLTHF